MGCSQWGRKESGMTEQLTLQHTEHEIRNRSPQKNQTNNKKEIDPNIYANLIKTEAFQIMKVGAF